MEFIEFARSHGLIIRDLDQGKWVRVPTEDHPHSRNGAYKYLVDHGFVQNHATMQSPEVWQSERKYDRIERAHLREKSADHERERIEGQKKAAKKAGWIIKNCVTEQHAYLDKKGFPDAQGLVWYPDENINLLAIPMLIDGAICGVQLINKDGVKTFLKGQRTDLATHVIDNKGPNWLVEGYITALSLCECLKSIKCRYTIHVCFSASNLIKVAKSMRHAYVCCDNDVSLTGEHAAQATGHPYYLPIVVGDDLNDQWKRDGTFKTAMSLQKWMKSVR